jgi:hypothetical protein
MHRYVPSTAGTYHPIKPSSTICNPEASLFNVIGAGSVVMQVGFSKVTVLEALVPQMKENELAEERGVALCVGAGGPWSLVRVSAGHHKRLVPFKRGSR